MHGPVLLVRAGGHQSYWTAGGCGPVDVIHLAGKVLLRVVIIGWCGLVGNDLVVGKV